MIVLAICLILEVVIIVSHVKKNGFFPYPHGTLCIIMGMQVALSIVYFDLSEPAIIKSFSTYTFFENFNAIIISFTLYFLIVYMSVRGVRIDSSVDLRTLIQSRTAELLGTPSAKLALNIVIIVVLVHVITLSLFLNWSVVWENSVYLGMLSATVLDPLNGFSWFLIQINLLIALIATCLLAYSISNGAFLQICILSPICFAQYLYFVAAGSRGSVLLLGAFAAVIFVMKRSKYIVGAIFVLAFSTLNYVLSARAESTYGFSMIAKFEGSLDFLNSDNVFRGFLNVFEGAFVIAELPNFKPEYDTAYKALSFSPFPSFVDDFNEILKDNFVGLNWFVPPSAIMEASAFGAPFLIFYIGFQVLVGRLSLQYLVKSGSFLSLFSNFILLFATYIQFAYPVRNVFRFYVIAFVIIIFAAKNYNSRGKGPSLVAPSVLSAQPIKSNAYVPAAVQRRHQRLKALRDGSA